MLVYLSFTSIISNLSDCMCQCYSDWLSVRHARLTVRAQLRASSLRCGCFLFWLSLHALTHLTSAASVGVENHFSAHCPHVLITLHLPILLINLLTSCDICCNEKILCIYSIWPSCPLIKCILAISEISVMPFFISVTALFRAWRGGFP